MRMSPISREGWRRAASWIAVAAAFVFVSYFVRGHEEIIRLLLAGGGAFGAVLFVVFTAVFVIFIIPLDLVLLIPLGVHLWGPLPTAFLSITGWTIGASTAFSVARRWGLPVVSRMVGDERVREFHDRIPKSNLFWSVVGLRMLVPVDLLSYAIGLFSHMSWEVYVLATLIGVAPFGFYFAYAGTLPLWYQFIAVALALSLTSLILYRYWRKEA